MLNNEGWLSLLCLLSLWCYVCITVFWKIAEYYHKLSRKFSCVFFICLFTSLLTFMRKVHPSSSIPQVSRHHAAWMYLLYSYTSYRIDCSDTCVVTVLLFVLHSPWLQRFSQKHIPESQCRMTIERKKIQKNQNIENCVGIMVHLNHLLLYWRTGVQFLATMLCGNPTLLTSGGICTHMHITTHRHPHIHVIKIIIH